MKTRLILFLLLVVAPSALALPPHRGPLLYCHRTANEDVPENTLASLEHAALLGCDLVEIDLRKTLDGEIVLNHDGQLERLTDGFGIPEQTTYAELELLDAGSWMSPRFLGIRIARFDDALRLARSLDIRLALDIKTKGIGVDVLRILEREGMMNRVQFGGEWDDIRNIVVHSTDAGADAVWKSPGISATEIKALHRQGKMVVVNFSANEHEMDLDSMRAAVANGADAINVDYPRLGADAVGRPVEQRLQHLQQLAASGSDDERANSIRELARYDDPDLQSEFLKWLDSSMPRTSHAAALALLLSRPQVRPEQLTHALHSGNTEARVNGAWLLGMLEAPAELIAPLVHDPEPQVRIASLRALARAQGTTETNTLFPLLEDPLPDIRGAAALAIAHLAPDKAADPISAQLTREIEAERALAEGYVQGGRKIITPEQIASATASFHVQMNMMHALSSIHTAEANSIIAHFAFVPVHEFAQMDHSVACFQLWDRAGENPAPIVAQLSSSNSSAADCAEWALINADSRVLPAVRAALSSSSSRRRAIRILAWHGDSEALATLQEIAHAAGPDSEQAAWAVEKIRTLRSPAD